MDEDKQIKKDREAVIKRLHEEEQEDRARDRASKNNLPYGNYRTHYTQPSLLSLIPEEAARTMNVAVAERTSTSITLAAADPDTSGLRELQKTLADREKVAVQLVIVSQKSLAHLWSGYEKTPKKASFAVGETEIRNDVITSIREQQLTFEAVNALIQDRSRGSTSDLLETILGGALFFRASDIHFEVADDDQVRLRYRVDGVLHDISTIPLKVYNLTLSRLKILSSMKINVTNVPQNGRFTIATKDRELEMRSAVAPSEHGEDTVLRILDPATINLDLQDLGVRPAILEKIKAAVSQPNGLILTTGPTGSGKTTSLYAFLKQRNSPDIKIITIEDPIEYHLEGIEQTEINPERGVTFFSSLSSALRRDPDIILVGEIRDGETANAAVQASLTGHVVFSTLHTNDAAGAIPRLLDLGVNASLIPSSLRLVIAQRLVRRICRECAQPKKPEKETRVAITKELASLPDALTPDLSTITLHQPNTKKCSACGGLGYKGRIGVFEAFIVDETMEQLMASTPSIAAIHAAAVKRGMITMKQDALLKLLEGITSLEEIKRVFGSFAT